MPIIRNKNKAWEITGDTSKWNSVYRDSVIKYLNCLDPLFEKAKNTSEFEFVQVLIRVRSQQDAGWDSWENTLEVFSGMMKLGGKIKNFKTRRHLFLWLYGHIVEASEPYEIIANLINIIDGRRFNVENFPDKSGRPQSPAEKIDALVKTAQKINMAGSTFPFQDIYNRELRNAIFHSDYVLYGDEVRLPKGHGRKCSNEEIQLLINKSLAYFESLRNLISLYIRNYESPVVIPVSREFSNDPQEMAVTIIRKNYGVVGLKDNWTLQEIAQGKIPFKMGRFLKYEREILERNPTCAVLPPNRVEIINKILNVFPGFIRRVLVRQFKELN